MAQAELEFERDVRRTLILGSYASAWGMPARRVVSRRGNDRVEVYTFPAAGDSVVTRYATVGISSLVDGNGKSADRELCVVVPADNGGAAERDVVNFVLDVMAYSLRPDVDFIIGRSIASSERVPAAWAARAILLDELRGEPQAMSQIKVGNQDVELIWLVPIHESERQMILHHGLDRFDEAEARSTYSLADPNRPAFE